MRAHTLLPPALICSISLLHASALLAEEIFCDPENPACQAPQAEPPAAESEEIFCDPENPACRAPEDPGSPAPPVFVDPGASATAPALSNLDFEVRWGTSLAVDTQWEGGGEDRVESGSAVDATLKLELSPRFGVVMSAQLRHWMGGGGTQDARADYEARLGTSYLLWREGRASLRVGMLQDYWGRMRLVRPNDVVSASDQRSFGSVGPALGDGSVAQLTAELGWSTPRWSLTGIVVPFFEPDRQVLFGRDIATAGPNSPLATSFPLTGLFEQLVDPSVWEDAQGLLHSPSRPDERPRSASLGARFTATALSADLGVGYYWGWDRTPYVQVDEDAAELLRLVVQDGQVFEDLDFVAFLGRNRDALMLSNALSEKAQRGEQLFAQSYDRRHTLMLDVERYVGQVGVRADVALSPAQNFVTQQLGTIRRPSVFGALGLSHERISGERLLALTVEGFWLEPFGAQHVLTRVFVPEARRGEGEQAAIIGERLYGVAAGAAWDLPVWKLNLQAGGVYNISSRDVLGRAALRRELVEGAWASVGVNIFEGPAPNDRLTLGGLFDANDAVYGGVDGVF